MAVTTKKRLGDILVEGGAITEEQLGKVLERQRTTGKRIGQILIDDGIISENKVAEVLSVQLKLPLVSLARYRPDPEALKLLPQHVAEKYLVVPLSVVDDGAVSIAMSDPLDLFVQDELSMLMNRNIRISVTSPSDIQNNLERLYNMQQALEGAIVEVVVEGEENGGETTLTSAGDAPVVQLVGKILEQAIQEGASDIHIEPFEKESRVRYRVDGKLFNAYDFPINLQAPVVSRLKILSNMDIAERRKPQDSRIIVRILGRKIDIRVSSLPTMYGEKMVLRILDAGNAMVGLQKLGFSAEDKKKVEYFCDLPWGFMLVTGPTGSGKSTTLYSMLEQINKSDVNIITVEDPVEYTMMGINQIQVNEKAGLTFGAALRSILRQDPDKVMVGEIRDAETVQLAIRAALTGHMVLSTLHTNDAPSAVARIIDMGIPSFLLSASLAGVLAQRLVRTLCVRCKAQYEIPESVCEQIKIPAHSTGWKAVGCSDCRGSGYRGRRGIHEIMTVDSDIRELILRGETGRTLYEQAIAKGMRPLR
ncbi:MAG: Flp pilus assembly complex ATPase component TadA, partial [Synergistaceae bacterium]|nr:Flp pilus assembly complex ATPase component TadA [Synergistaceae bacterium]